MRGVCVLGEGAMREMMMSGVGVGSALEKSRRVAVGGSSPGLKNLAGTKRCDKRRRSGAGSGDNSVCSQTYSANTQFGYLSGLCWSDLTWIQLADLSISRCFTESVGRKTK